MTYIGVAVGFLTTFFVLTRFLTAEEIGLARVLIDAATLFVGLAQLGTTSSIIRFYPYFQTAKRNPNTPSPLKGRAGEGSSSSDNGFWFWTIIIPLAGFLLFTGLYLVCHQPIVGWFDEKSPLFGRYYYFVLPMALCMLYQSVFETSSNVLMRIVVPRAVRELIVRIGLLICYLLYAYRILNMDQFVLSICVNYAIAALINMCYLMAHGHISWRPDWAFLRQNHALVRNYFFYTGFLIISALASVLAPTLSSFFITAQMGLNFTGIFAIATYMAVMVSIPYRSLTAIASPQLARAIKENNQSETSTLMQQVVGNTLLVGTLIFLMMWVNIDLIFHILPNGETYVSARSVVFILGLSQLIMAAFSICQVALNYSRYYVFSLLFSFVLTLSAIGLNNYLIPLYGMDGAAMSNLISYGVYFLLIIVTLCLALRINPFSWRMAVCVAIMAIALILNYLWQLFLPISNIWLSSIVRSLVLVGGATFVAYRCQLSPEINALLRSIFIQRH